MSYNSNNIYSNNIYGEDEENNMFLQRRLASLESIRFAVVLYKVYTVQQVVVRFSLQEDFKAKWNSLQEI